MMKIKLLPLTALVAITIAMSTGLAFAEEGMKSDADSVDGKICEFKKPKSGDASQAVTSNQSKVEKDKDSSAAEAL